MELNKKMYEVICDLEHEIGSECYNPNSYDGWNEVKGCEYRYPINVPNKDGEYTKIRGNIYKTPFLDQRELVPDSIKYMKYKFGSNELFIGLGLIDVLEYLETRYGLDFNELEKKK